MGGRHLTTYDISSIHSIRTRPKQVMMQKCDELNFGVAANASFPIRFYYVGILITSMVAHFYVPLCWLSPNYARSPYGHV